MTAFASIDNVIFVFYQAALSGEISKDEFLKAKEIIKRTTLYTTSDILDMTARLVHAKEIELEEQKGYKPLPSQTQHQLKKEATP